MITVKELIEKLQKLDPNAYVVKMGHPDESGGYDPIDLDELSKLITIAPFPSRDWRGEYCETEFKQPNGFWAYCV